MNFTNRVLVDPAYANLPVSVEAESIQELSCGDILRYVCMATGTWPKADASTGYLAAGPMGVDGNKLTLDNLNKYPAIMAGEDVAAVSVNDYTAEGNVPACGNVVEIVNPFITSGADVSAARSLLSFYGGNRMETLGRGDPASEIGDLDVIWLSEGNAVSARRVKQELSLSNGVLKNCASSFIKGNTIYTAANRIQILSTGTFTVPEGVWQIRVVLVGHGSDGTAGTDGTWFNFRYYTENDLAANPTMGAGSSGDPGAGGKVWSGIIDVNPGQVIQITVGNDTTLWHYSSADGKNYENGFIDVGDGSVFGRTGGGGGAGTGDGGVAGSAGRGGSYYEQGWWYYDDGHVAPGGGALGNGVDVNYDGPGHWEVSTVVEWEPTRGGAGGKGATGSAIIYWDDPEVIE